MGTTGQTRQHRRAPRWQLLPAWGSLALTLTITTGCSPTSTTAQQSYDPLHGVRTPPGAVAPPNNPATGTASAVPPPAPNLGSVPALPTSSSAANTATLAGTSGPNPLGQPFPINDPNGRAPFLPAQATTSNAAPVPAPGAMTPNPNPKVEQVPDAVPNAPPAITPLGTWQPPQTAQPVVQTNAAVAPDYAKQLQDRGVTNQKLDPAPGGVLLTCYVSNGASGVRILTVPAKDYAAAAQAMLRELDRPR